MTGDAPRSAFDAAVRILARRGHGRAELGRKLRDRGHESDAISEAIARCESIGYLEPEAEVALRYARELANKRGATPRAVRQKLRQRGFDDEDTRAAVHDAFRDWDARVAARETVEGTKDPQKAARSLSRRGFPSDAIMEAVRHLRSDVEKPSCVAGNDMDEPTEESQE